MLLKYFAFCCFQEWTCTITFVTLSTFTYPSTSTTPSAQTLTSSCGTRSVPRASRKEPCHVFGWNFQNKTPNERHLYAYSCVSQSFYEYGDLFSETWRAFSDNDIIHLKTYDSKRVGFTVRSRLRRWFDFMAFLTPCAIHRCVSETPSSPSSPEWDTAFFTTHLWWATSDTLHVGLSNLHVQLLTPEYLQIAGPQKCFCAHLSVIQVLTFNFTSCDKFVG